MAEHLTVDEVDGIEDTDVLWRALRNAKEQDEHALVRAIENRMRQLGQERRYAHLSDEQLRRQIRGLSGNREPKDLLGYSPASEEGYEGAADTAALNRAIKDNQRDGVEATLGALLDEWRRRGGDDEG
jgi:hypothetical protein